MAVLTEKSDRLRLRKSGIIVYEGSPASSHLAEQVMMLILEWIKKGADLSIRKIQMIRNSFDEERCVYALDPSGRLIGFVYLEIISNFGKKSCVERCALVTVPEFKMSDLSGNLIDSIFELAAEKYPCHDFLSRSSNPIVWNFNKKIGLREISFQELWDIYGIDVIQANQKRPNISFRFKRIISQKNFFENIQIINDITGCPEKCMVFARS